MAEFFTQTVELAFGYKSHDGNEHKTVIIGRRPTGADLMRIGDAPEGEKPSQYQLLTIQAAITKFGDLKMPVPLTVLLNLLRPDRDLLAEAYMAFTKATGTGHISERLSTDKFRLAHGFKIGEVVYDCVTFGHLLTGFDEIKADDLTKGRRVCYLLGMQITLLSQSEGVATLSGPLDVELFESLDAEDILDLQEVAGEWNDSFRAKGRIVQGEGGAGSGLPDAPPQTA